MKTKAIELRGAVENAIVVKECQNIEYKSNWHDDYLKWICGYANAQGGVIYFGMDDDHKVVGLEDVERLLEDIPMSPVRFEGMQRYEELEVPKAALREILYNAITHKDYTGPDIQMHVYNDHVEIWNEGELPSGYSEKVLYGKHSSKPRNRNIANAMFRAGFIDSWGRGYSKIYDGFKAAGLPMPTVEPHCGGTLVSFQRGFDVVRGRRNVTSNVPSNVPSDVGSSVGSLSVVQLSERQKKICKLIKENPFISTQQMSVVLSVVKRTAERDLSDMEKKGVLIREGNTSAGHWVLLLDV